MDALATWITRVNESIFRLVSWLCLALVLLYFSATAARYLFDYSDAALQESALYLHALIFLGAAAACVARDQHVRVDVFYARWSTGRKALVNLFGSLCLLLPFAAFLLWISWDYVARAWAIREASMDPGGLPLVYALKTLILVAAAQLALQALAQATNALAVLRRTAPDSA
jgi:TRAP-type mannitol/chloroaromatic compound transport system permease small subunit